jgi:hypothetical protein
MATYIGQPNSVDMASCGFVGPRPLPSITGGLHPMARRLSLTFARTSARFIGLRVSMRCEAKRRFVLPMTVAELVLTQRSLHASEQYARLLRACLSPFRPLSSTTVPHTTQGIVTTLRLASSLAFLHCSEQIGVILLFHDRGVNVFPHTAQVFGVRYFLQSRDRVSWLEFSSFDIGSPVPYRMISGASDSPTLVVDSDQRRRLRPEDVQHLPTLDRSSAVVE